MSGLVRVHITWKNRRLRVAFGKDVASCRVTDIFGTKPFTQGLQRSFSIADPFLLHIGSDQVNRKTVSAEHRELIVGRGSNHRYFRSGGDLQRQNSSVLQ